MMSRNGEEFSPQTKIKTERAMCMKKYKLQAVLETTGGKLHVDCRLIDGWIDGVFTGDTGSYIRYFASRKEVWYYLHNRLQVKSVIKIIEVIG